ncbi:MAG: hypothetical protein ACRCSF_05690 [Mycobacteriaceae bacterium]
MSRVDEHGDVLLLADQDSYQWNACRAELLTRLGRTDAAILALQAAINSCP